MELLWLSEKDVASLLTVEDALPLVESAFVSIGKGEARMPPKVYLDFSEFNGDLRAMPAYLPKAGVGGKRPFAGVKVVNSHPGNPEKGLPTVAAVMILNDPETGMPLALISAGHLTDMRTGAAGGVAAKHLARQESAVVGLVGCGRQAATQWRALRDLFEIREVRVAGRTFQEAETFCRQEARGQKPVFMPCRSVKDACRADIVVTTTPSHEPVVKAEWIRPGTHVNAIGADAPGKQELETALLLKSRVFVDLAEQAFHAGEVNVPLTRGELKPENITGNLGDVLVGRKKGRRSAEEITVFDSTGLAAQDVAVGAWVYQKAVEKKIGVKLT
ncbi:MAG: alanine dehydrogenase [Elusimicrobia bacterium]|nr:alanine dehydrogenase [Elusimicrobiota bacterium]